MSASLSSGSSRGSRQRNALLRQWFILRFGSAFFPRHETEMMDYIGHFSNHLARNGVILQRVPFVQPIVVENGDIEQAVARVSAVLERVPAPEQGPCFALLFLIDDQIMREDLHDVMIGRFEQSTFLFYVQASEMLAVIRGRQWSSIREPAASLAQMICEVDPVENVDELPAGDLLPPLPSSSASSSITPLPTVEDQEIFEHLGRMDATAAHTPPQLRSYVDEQEPAALLNTSRGSTDPWTGRSLPPYEGQLNGRRPDEEEDVDERMTPMAGGREAERGRGEERGRDAERGREAERGRDEERGREAERGRDEEESYRRRVLTADDVIDAFERIEQDPALLDGLADDMWFNMDIDRLFTPPFFAKRTYNEALLQLIADAVDVEPRDETKLALIKMTRDSGLISAVFTSTIRMLVEQQFSALTEKSKHELCRAIETLLQVFSSIAIYDAVTADIAEVYVEFEKTVLGLPFEFWEYLGPEKKAEFIQKLSFVTSRPAECFAARIDSILPTERSQQAAPSVSHAEPPHRHVNGNGNVAGKWNEWREQADSDDEEYVRKMLEKEGEEERYWREQRRREEEEERMRREEEIRREEEEMERVRLQEEERRHREYQERRRREKEEDEKAMAAQREAQAREAARISSIQKHKEEKEYHQKLYQESEECEPPCSFRALPDRPVVEDLYKPKKPYIRRALVDGTSKYEDAEHYLDVQFRLLREDMISPLRDGLKSYIETGGLARNQRIGNSRNKMPLPGDHRPDLVVLQKVVVGGAQVRVQTGETMRYLIIPQIELRTIDLGKQLRFGQVVVLSIDNFQKDFKIALIVERIDVMLEKFGKLGVHFFDESLEDTEVAKQREAKEEGPLRGRPLLGGEYFLAEPSSYFEAYHHVLKTMKKMNRSHPIAFERYLADGKTDIWQPSFMRASTTEQQRDEVEQKEKSYDDKCKKQREDERKRHCEGDKSGYWTEEEQDMGNRFDYMHPSPSMLSKVSIRGAEYRLDHLEDSFAPEFLDETQKKAICTALKSEIAMIQGPPGTGKTHIGVEIIMTILENRTRWRITKPILIVTYTNQALDQFLEKILTRCECSYGSQDYFPLVVRLGSRCECERLKGANVVRRDALVEFDARRRRGEVVHQSNSGADLGKARRVKEATAKALGKSARALRCGLNGEVPSSSFIRQVMDTNHDMQLRSFVGRLRDTKGNPLSSDEEMVCWLLDKDYTNLNGSDPNGTASSSSNAFSGMGNFDMTKKKEHEKTTGTGGKNNGGKKKETKKEQNERKREEKRERAGRRRTRHNDDESDTDEEMRDADSIWGDEEEDEGMEEDDEDAEVEKMTDEQLAKMFEAINVRADKIEEETRTREEAIVERIYETECAWDIEAEFKATVNEAVLMNARRKLIVIQNCKPTWIAIDAIIERDFHEAMTDIINARPMTREEALAVEDIRQLTVPARHQLFSYYRQLALSAIRHCLPRLFRDYKNACEEMMSALRERDEEVLSKALVIGATTTGAAKARKLLSQIGCPVLVVEEAAEVLEAHLLTSLLPCTRQAIFIGDHQQLRPSTAVHQLASMYNLEISLFERLLKNGLPFSTLLLQHRMLPLLTSTIVQPYFYPELKDADSVREYPAVQGMAKNMFFWAHKQPETALAYDNTSHCNDAEIGMAVDLASYLLLQRQYTVDDITIIATYAAQVNRLRQEVGRRFGTKKVNEGRSEVTVLAVETVDSFQGKENKIIILSLVRSMTSTIGFIGVANRICVALTRAQHGFYVVGNFEFIREKSQLWEGITTTLFENELIDYGLPIKCITHGNIQTVNTVKEFSQKARHGGCSSSMCNQPLNCGHICKRPCHPPAEHSDPASVRGCNELCLRKCESCGVGCKKKCSQECGDCQTPISLSLVCGHEVMAACHERETATCREPCVGILDCGHPCAETCGMSCTLDCVKELSFTYPRCQHTTTITCKQQREHDIPRCAADCNEQLFCGHACKAGCGKECTVFCEEMVERTLSCGHSKRMKCHEDSKQQRCTIKLDVQMPECGHTARVDCADQQDVTKCTFRCKEKAACDHECGQKCGECKRVGHKCSESCAEVLRCGHKCQSGCGRECGPCILYCQTQCSHIKCGLPPLDGIHYFFGRNCDQPCALCCFACDNKCKHRSCTKKCFEVCNVERCEQPCEKKLDCGHACLGMCGERCPKVCGTCKPSLYREVVECSLGAGYLEMSMEKKKELPRVLGMPVCTHILPVEFVDRRVEEMLYAGRLPTCPFPGCGQFIDGLRRYAKERRAYVMLKDASSKAKQRPLSPSTEKEYRHLRAKFNVIDKTLRDGRKNNRRPAIKLDPILNAIAECRRRIDQAHDPADLDYYSALTGCCVALSDIATAYNERIVSFPVLGEAAPVLVRSVLDAAIGKRVVFGIVGDRVNEVAVILEESLFYKRRAALVPAVIADIYWLTVFFHLCYAYTVMGRAKSDLPRDKGARLRSLVRDVIGGQLYEQPAQRIREVHAFLREFVFEPHNNGACMEAFFFDIPTF